MTTSEIARYDSGVDYVQSGREARRAAERAEAKRRKKGQA